MNHIPLETGQMFAGYALRDIQAFITFGILEQTEGGGRSTNYVLKVDEQ